MTNPASLACDSAVTRTIAPAGSIILIVADRAAIAGRVARLTLRWNAFRLGTVREREPACQALLLVQKRTAFAQFQE